MAAAHISRLTLNEYLYGPRSMIESCGTAHGKYPLCWVVHGEWPVIVDRLPYRRAVHRIMRAGVAKAALVGNSGQAEFRHVLKTLQPFLPRLNSGSRAD